MIDQQQLEQPQPQPQQQPQPPPQPQQPAYTIPGILHYLEHEWRRFEVEKQEWEVERAELSARIALLQGEKKSNENLKHDLIRRIKMLEYCLRMERAKYYKLKHGGDLSASQLQLQPSEPANDGQLVTAIGRDDITTAEQANNFLNTTNSNGNSSGAAGANSSSSTVAYGRELLKHYLQEIGFTDTIIDLRSNSIRSLTSIVGAGGKAAAGANDSQPQATHFSTTPVTATDRHQSAQNNSGNQQLDSASNKHANETQQHHNNIAGRLAAVVEAGGQQHESDEQELENSLGSLLSIVDSQLETIERQQLMQQQHHQNQQQPKQLLLQPSTQQPQQPVTIDIGELATLTTLDSDSPSDDSKRKQWAAKYRLQSHFDCVRALRFSETDPLIVTASEDETLKLWHLVKPLQTSGKSSQSNLPPSLNTASSLETDIEPLHTYRGHTSRILSLALSREHIFSGAQNGELIKWRIIAEPSSADQYDKYDSSLLVFKFVAHDDAIWSLELLDSQQVQQTNNKTALSLLCSASADLTLKIWNFSCDNREPLAIIKLDSSPTCLASMPLCNVCQVGADLAVGFNDGKIKLYDVTSCLSTTNQTTTELNTQAVATFSSDETCRINSIVIHPTLPYMASADSKHDIKFWDMKEPGGHKAMMVAHLDEVTSLACDPTGKYLLSASHDCSVRIWLFEEKACIQEITSHRKKFDEGIFAVAFHPSLSHFATAGADGLAKVFV